MGILTKIKKLKDLEFKVLLILPSALFWVIFSSIVLVFFSFNKISNLLGEIKKESPLVSTASKTKLRQISTAIDLISRNVPWKAQCYVQALAAKMMLRMRNVDCTIYLGFRKSVNNFAEGHAWVRAGEIIVTGKHEYKSYKIIANYA